MTIENLLGQLKKIDEDYNVIIRKDNCIYPVNGFEDSTSIGIWGIRYWEMSCSKFPGIKVSDLIKLIPENLSEDAVMVTRGNCYPVYKIANIYSDGVGSCVIEITDFKTDDWWED